LWATRSSTRSTARLFARPRPRPKRAHLSYVQSSVSLRSKTSARRNDVGPLCLSNRAGVDHERGVPSRTGGVGLNIEHFALNVSDPVAAAAWYTQHLGMRVIRSLDAAPFTHFLADSAGRVVMELYKQTKAPMPDYATMDPLVFHIAFLTADVRG